MILTKDKQPIDISPWMPQMLKNVLLKRPVFELTPIGKNADGEHFFWDEEKNQILDEASVNKLVTTIRRVH